MKRTSFSVICIISILFLSSMQSINTNTQTAKAETYFAENFDGTAEGWLTQSGTWLVTNKEYYVSVGLVENGISIVKNLNLIDYTIETQLRFNDNLGFRAGIVFRYIDAQHYYAFELSNEYDTCGIIRYTPEDYGYTPKSIVVSLVDGSYPIQVNTNYNLKVTVKGNSFVGYINDVLVLNGTDSTFTYGEVGLRARAAGAVFDNFLVYSGTPNPTTTPNPTPQPDPSGLVGYWTFNEGSGNVVYDMSGYNNNGIIFGASRVEGKSGGALGFDGINDYVTIPHSISLDFSGAQPFTLMAWIKLGAAQQGQTACVIDKYPNYGLLSDHYESRFRSVVVRSGSVFYSAGEVGITPEVWHHYVGVYDPPFLIAYLDGSETTRINVGSLVLDTSTGNFSIGASRLMESWFKGIIDEARIYNRALSQVEITSLYGITVKHPTLTVSCKSSTSFSGFKVEIEGNLTDNSNPLSNEPVLLSFSVTGGKTWQELTLAYTNSDGSYSAEWRPSVTGNYLIRASFEGNDYSGASEIVNLAVTSYAEENVFSVGTNSTISNLFFNSTSKELSFSVTGPTDTSGYANVYIAKGLIQDISGVNVYLDGNKLDYSAISTEDSWLLHFTYQHSTHEVTVNLVSSTLIGENQLGNWLIYLVIAIVAVIAIIGIMIALKRRKIK